MIPPQMKNNVILVREFIDDVLNQGNVEATGKYFHEDVLEQAPFPGQGPGLSGVKDVLRGFLVAFPDMHWSVEEQIEEGDKVVSRFCLERHPSNEILGRCRDRTHSVRLEDRNRPRR